MCQICDVATEYQGCLDQNNIPLYLADGLDEKSLSLNKPSSQHRFENSVPVPVAVKLHQHNKYLEY